MLFDSSDLLPPTPSVLAGRRLLLAYSGGLDSTVLLDALSKQGQALRVAHVHHGLQPAADDWVQHCQAQCEGRGVSLQVLQVRIAADDAEGPEGAARRERYAALRACLQAGEVLVTAHQADDQAETFLMRALRGAGPRGLGAMTELQLFAPGWLWRPLLARTRTELQAYADAQGLHWIEDPHNRDPRYQRSWLRSEVLPVLGARQATAVASLGRSAALCAEADDLLAELATEDAGDRSGAETLSVAALRALSPARRRNLLRWWIGQVRDLPLPPYAVMMQIGDLLDAGEDAAPRLHWSGAELRRYRDQLFAFAPLPEPPPAFEQPWDGRGRLRLPPGCGWLLAGTGEPPAPLSVRLPRGGERLRLGPGRPSRSLKNLFQEQGVPPWQRRRTPLVYENEVLRWVGGLALLECAAAFYPALRWHQDEAAPEETAPFL